MCRQRRKTRLALEGNPVVESAMITIGSLISLGKPGLSLELIRLQ